MSYGERMHYAEDTVPACVGTYLEELIETVSNILHLIVDDEIARSCHYTLRNHDSGL